MVLIENYLLQLLFSVGIIVIFGVAINIFNKLFYRILGRNGYKFCVATGFVGTPVHELSHAAMCVIFGHKVLKMKLFPSFNKERTLGYVNHSYNKNNLYHLIGNFFIGLAPVIFGSLTIYLLMYILARPTFEGFYSALSSAEGGSGLTAQTFSQIGSGFVLSIKALFNALNLTSFFWWVFIILSSFIALHMSVSPADIKAGKTGFIFVAVLLFAVDFAFYLVKDTILFSITHYILLYSVFVINFLTVSLLFCIFLILLALILRPIFSAR